MCQVHTVADIRAAESGAIAAVGEATLMRRAASAVARVVADHLEKRRSGGVPGATIVLLVGPGNNGGDALYAGVELLGAGARVTAWLASDKVHQPGLADFTAAGGTTLTDMAALRTVVAPGGQEAGRLTHGAHPATDAVDALVDGLLGIGARAGLTGAMAEVAQALTAWGQPWTVAVDLPSGIAVEPPFAPLTGPDAVAHLVANATVTFGGLKVCHVLDPGRTACGHVTLVDIGLGPMAPLLRGWERSDVAAAWPVPTPADDKYSRGVVGVDTGSARYPGAAVLSTLGAVRGGAGFIRYCGATEAVPALVARTPSVTVGPGRVQAWVLGCGWDGAADNRARLAHRVADGVPCVIDATALDSLRDTGTGLPDGSLLTPHAGELARLIAWDKSAVVADPITAARTAADRFGAVVLLKGSRQIVATPGTATVDLALAGPAWTAQAGSGDVLAGVCGTLLAAGLPATTAACLAASLQALTARRHLGPYSPDQLADRFPKVIARLTAAARRGDGGADYTGHHETVRWAGARRTAPGDAHPPVG